MEPDIHNVKMKRKSRTCLCTNLFFKNEVIAHDMFSLAKHLTEVAEFNWQLIFSKVPQVWHFRRGVS